MDSNRNSRYYTYIKPALENKIVRSTAPYVFSIISIAIFISFAIRPTISTISNLQKEIDNNQQILDGLTNKSKNLSLGIKNYNNLDSATKAKINQAIPNDPNIARLVATLGNSAISSQASISALQIQPVVLFSEKKLLDHLAAGEVSFSFNIQGDYLQILGVIDKLAQSSRVINIDNVVLNKPGGEPTTLSVSGRAYFLK